MHARAFCPCCCNSIHIYLFPLSFICVKTMSVCTICPCMALLCLHQMTCDQSMPSTRSVEMVWHCSQMLPFSVWHALAYPRSCLAVIIETMGRTRSLVLPLKGISLPLSFRLMHQQMCMAQMMTILATVLGRFQVRLAERMGGWQGCLQKQTCSDLLGIHGGMWCHFLSRAAA